MTRFERWLPILIGIAVATSAIAAIRPLPVGVFQDDGIYVVLAKSLATGEGYRYLNLPGAPNATHYPPLYPGLLALLWKVNPAFPDNIVLFKFVNACSLGIAATGTFFVGRYLAGLSSTSAAVVAIVGSVATPLIQLSAMVLSEPLFLLILMPTLLLSHRAARTGRISDVAMAGAAAVVLTLCRSIGFVVVPALGIALASRRHWRGLVMAVVVVAIGLTPWKVWVASHAGEIPPVLMGKYGSYSNWITEAVSASGASLFLGTVQSNLIELWVLAGQVIGVASTPTSLRVVATLLFVTILVVGVAKLTTRTPVLSLFILLYLAAVVAWPFSPKRFTFALWPLICLLFAVGAQYCWQLRHRTGSNEPRLTLRRAAVGLILSTLILGYTTFSVRFLKDERLRGEEATTAQRALPTVKWIIEKTNDGDVIATDDDILVHLYTGRRTTPVTGFTALEYLAPKGVDVFADQLRQLLAYYQPSFVAISTLGAMHAANGLVAANPSELTHVATLETGAVFVPREVRSGR